MYLLVGSMIRMTKASEQPPCRIRLLVSVFLVSSDLADGYEPLYEGQHDMLTSAHFDNSINEGAVKTSILTK